ncbi:MAG TPA: pantetheine-phosphate adenylyltransferase [Candidatus Enterosoma merdigallinarum]|mgnify:CR=1 FL=1|nr:pantetheine-phosphate adenylyltransferase [Candidatus Enterosoma merdigallinarum]
MRIACYPGSFDPLTVGHVDVALRARRIFDKVIILIADNPKKASSYLFTAEERKTLAEETFRDHDGFEVQISRGLVVKKAKELGAIALIRGLRAVTDYEAEYQLHEVNEYIEPSIDMVYLMSHRVQAFVSSSNIKEMFLEGADITGLVPDPVYKAMQKKLKR